MIESFSNKSELFGYLKDNKCLRYEFHSYTQIVTLLEIIKFKKDGGTFSVVADKKSGRHKPFWIFLEKVSLLNEAETHFDRYEQQTLSDFCLKACKGDIKKAIFIIDLLAYKSQSLNKANLFKHLQELSNFVRNIADLIINAGARPELKYNEEDFLRKNNNVYDLDRSPYLPHPARALSLLDKSVRSDITRRVVPNEKLPERHPDMLHAGFCLICHRPSKISDQYCSTHKDARRTDMNMMNTAYKNILLSISQPSAIQSHQTFFLEGSSFPAHELFATHCDFNTKVIYLKKWGEKHKLHMDFMEDIQTIEFNDGVKNFATWGAEHIYFLNRLIQIINESKHMKGRKAIALFNTSDDSHQIESRFKTYFSIQEENFELTIKVFGPLIKRMSIFNVIRFAAKNNPLKPRKGKK